MAEALAHPLRREILEHLLRAHTDHEAVSISSVAQALDIERLTASYHLRVLVRSGLVTVVRRANRRVHALNPAGLAAMEDWLAPFFELAYLLRAGDDEPIQRGAEAG